MKKIILILLGLFVSLNVFSQDKEERYVIKNLSVNNSNSNFGTSLYGNDKMIFAMPAKRNYIISNVWKGNNQPYLDLFIGDIKEDGELKNIQKFSKEVNTRFHEADVSFTKDKKTVYFTRSNFHNGKYIKDSLGINRIKLFKATLASAGEWDVVPMAFNDDNYSCGHPSLSDDGKTLYFISDMPGTLGKTDIYKVTVNDDGTYGEPVNLGPEINTPEKEMFPYIDGNNDLYYSTNGRAQGLGMLDVFLSRFSPDGSVSEPIHLGNNINSDKDDFAFLINTEKREGYFSSNRDGGKGDDDIYYFKEDIPLPCNQKLHIVVKNIRTGEILPEASVKITKGDELLVEGVTNNEGFFDFEVDCETVYYVNGVKKFFKPQTKTVETNDVNGTERLVELLLEPDEFVIVRDKTLIDINTIYFDFDKYNIREDAAIELDKVVKIMNKYPKLIVKCGSHTDSRGPDKYNFVLSNNRAKSTVDYIVTRGIDADRISSKGYGETELVNKCSNRVRCSEQEHQLNRRTEFVIANPEVLE